MNKMLFLVNPNAGHGTIRPAMLDILALFSSRYIVTVFITTGPSQITAKIAEEGREFDIVVVAGGDGSLSEAAAGLSRLPVGERPLLGYIPAGTTNDMAASLSIPANSLQAAKVILEGREFHLDLGTLNDRTFTYVAAFGAFTAVTYETPQEEKKALGYLAYVLEGARSLADIRPIHARITADGVAHEGDFLVGGVGNTFSVGGMHSPMVSKLAISLNDGMNEGLFIRSQADPLQYAAIFAEASQMNLSNPEHFLFLKAKDFRVEFDEMIPWTIDGEAGGIHNLCEIRNVPDAIRIMIPANKEF